MLCRVPPEIRSLRADATGGLVGDDVDVDLGEVFAPALARGLGGEQHGEVGRQRLEAAGLDDLHPGRRGALVEGVDRCGA